MSKTRPRSASSLGLFGRYDGNIIGGFMIGLGMTITGACPGTVLVQLATGIHSGWYVLAGGVLGGIIYNRLSGHLRRNQACASPDDKLTVQSKLNIETNYAVLAYEMLCLALISLATILGPEGTSVPLHPLVGGALIGAAQAASLILTDRPVGVSTGYDVVGAYFWRAWRSLVGYDLKSVARPPLESIYFAAGIIAGSKMMIRTFPSTMLETGTNIGAVRGVIGGLILVLGARIAGGCTSGHGISGMSMLSISSIITVASMFLGGFSSALMF